MAFAYYKRLTRRQQGIYRKSNEVPAVQLPSWRAVQPIVRRLEEALPSGDRHVVQELCTELLSTMADGLKIRRVRIVVLARRPSDETEELHGCYQPGRGGRTRRHQGLDAHRQAQPGRRLQVLPAHRAARVLPSPGLYAARAGGFIPYGGVLSAGVEFVSSIDA